MTFGNIRPVKINHFSSRNPIFEVPMARRGQIDKFVAIGIPEARTGWMTEAVQNVSQSACAPPSITQQQQRQRGESKLQRPPSLKKERLQTPTRLSSTTTTPPPLPPAKCSAKPFMQDLTINLFVKLLRFLLPPAQKHSAAAAAER